MAALGFTLKGMQELGCSSGWGLSRVVPEGIRGAGVRCLRAWAFAAARPGLCPWTGSFLSLSFLICKMGVAMIPLPKPVETMNEITFLEAPSTCLSLSRHLTCCPGYVFFAYHDKGLPVSRRVRVWRRRRKRVRLTVAQIREAKPGCLGSKEGARESSWEACLEEGGWS